MDSTDNISNSNKALDGDFKKVKDAVTVVTLNLGDVVNECKQLCNEINKEYQKPTIAMNVQKKVETMQEKYCLVEKKSFNKLSNEIKVMSESLPKLLTKDLLHAPMKIIEKGKELQKVSSEKESLEKELQVLKKRYDAVLSEIESERQENADLRKQVINWKAVTEQQSDFCARLGVATCSLLWRSTQIEEAVQSMLVGEHAGNFFEVANHTLDYFILAIEDSSLKLDELSAEYQFVVALAGVLTNISASADGRDTLVVVQQGKSLLIAITTMLCILPFKDRFSKLRNLCLKLIYNISINEKGMKLLFSQKEIFSNLVDTLKNEKSTENKLQVVRVLQSFLNEVDSQDNIAILSEHISFKLLKQLTNGARGEVKDAFEELIADFLMLEREQ